MEPDERMDGRITGGRGETRDAWKKKDDKGKEYHRRKEEEGNHRGIHRSRGNDSGRG